MSIVTGGSGSSRTATRDELLLLALSDERDRWHDLVLDAWQDGYRAALSDAVVESLLRIFPEPGHVSEIEKRRYPPDGRAHFADRRPGDFPGRCHG